MDYIMLHVVIFIAYGSRSFHAQSSSESPLVDNNYAPLLIKLVLKVCTSYVIKIKDALLIA